MTFLTVITKYNEKTKDVEFAICDPSNIGDILNSSVFVSYKIKFVVTSFTAIQNALETLYPRNARTVPISEASGIEVDERLEEFKNVKSFRVPSNFPEEIKRIIEDNKNSLVRPLFEILYDSARVGASEVHFEVFSDQLKVFIKINGRFFNLNHSIKPENYEYIVAKVKHMGKLNYSEDRIFQVSNFSLNLSSLKLFVNALTVPSLFGENMVLRLLALNNFPKPLEGYFKYQKSHSQKVREALLAKSGLIVLTSTDWFGLAKFYYSLINELSKMRLDKKIVSIEKDLIYPLNDVSQVEYSLVSEPSLKMVHETAINLGANIIATSVVHDQDSFEYVQKSLSTDALVIIPMAEPTVGHVIDKLRNSKFARNIMPDLLMIVAAKNVDFICNFCREEDLDQSVIRGYKVYHGRGCHKCHMTGIGSQSFIFETYSPLDARERKGLAGSDEAKEKLEYDRFEVLTNEFAKEGIIL